MCGIAGILLPEDRKINPAQLALLSDKLAHRGPDDLGFYAWHGGKSAFPSKDPKEACAPQDHLAFVHRRLTILDESTSGWQPMQTGEGRYTLTYNGEIYNYLELRADLEKDGLSFTSSGDTEVLLKALIHWGVEKTLPRLVGMFAFALFDAHEQKIIWARDPFGIKPLSWMAYQGGIAFASELSALVSLSGSKRKIEAQELYHYLRFGFTDLGTRSLFDGVEHLPPAHYAILVLNDLKVNPVRYWSPNRSQNFDLSFDEATSHLKGLFEKSVDIHLRSDVPVGAALSGGIDSSAVVAMMRALKGDDLNLHTFSFIAPGDKVDEESWADLVGQKNNAQMHKVLTSGSELVDDLDKLIFTQGEPFGSTSIYAQYRVFGLARDHNVPVTLDGQGADEILAGYVPFLAARLATLIKKGQFGRAQQFLKNAVATSGSKAPLVLRALRFLLPDGLQKMGRAFVGEKLVPDWMNGAWFEERQVALEAKQKPISGDVLHHELRESLTSRVLPSLLRYEDRSSMAHSIESRVPFLTPEIVDFLYSLPEDYLISDQGITKAIFREAMRGIVPDPILDRRDKIGFATPQSSWMGEVRGWVNDVLSSLIAKEIPPLATSAFQSKVEAVRDDQRVLSPEVWRWVNLIKWAEIYDVEFD